MKRYIGAGIIFALALCSPVAAAAGTTLAPNAPLPGVVPPGTTLVVGGPTLQRMFQMSGELARLPFKVVFTTISGGPGVLDAFRSNALDVGSGNDIPAIFETWLGFDVRIISVSNRHAPHPAQFGIAAGSNIKSFADLKGKKIAYSAGQAQGSMVLRVLKRYGIKKSEVQLIPLPSRTDVYVNALVAHLVDAAPIGGTVFAKHFIDQYGKDGAKLLTPDGITVNPVNLWVRADLLKDPAKAAALASYLKAYIRATHWIETHRQQWIEQYYIKDQGLSPEDAAYVASALGTADFPSNWDQSIRDEQDTINFMAEESGNKPFDARQIFDRRFEAVTQDAKNSITNGAH